MSVHEGSYKVTKDDIIFSEGTEIESLNILVKGETDVYLSLDCDNDIELQKEFKIFSTNENIFIGAIGLFLDGKFPFSYRAANDSILFSYPMNNTSQFYSLLQSQKDYAALTIMSISLMAEHAYKTLVSIENHMKKLSVLADNLSLLFWELKEKNNLMHSPSIIFLNEAREKYDQCLDMGLLPDALTASFLVKEIPEISDLDYSYLDTVVLNKLQYFNHIKSLSLQVKINFFGADEYITNYHLIDAAKNLEAIKFNVIDAIKICENYFNLIYKDTEKCIFSELICLTREANKYNQNTDMFSIILDELTKTITDINYEFTNQYHYAFIDDCKKLENAVKELTFDKNSKEQESGELEINPSSEMPEELIDSAEKIIRYSEISTQKAELLRNGLNSYRLIQEEANNDQNVRIISRAISPIFYELYELVFKKFIAEGNNSRLFKMFLTYGYMDERLLTKKQTITLYNLTDEINDSDSCEVYNIYGWLKEIYNMEKEPSINEFDQDYFDVFREMVKRRELSDKERIKYNNDEDGRLNFEITNMFRTNHRLCYGQFDFFPVLNSNMIVKDISDAFVTKKSVNKIINKILSVDYSAFYRESLYQNPLYDIEKELVSMAIVPDIILMPTFGFRGSMWQDITGRSRNTPGRIILPIFTSENLENILLHMIGNFRWELCRSMMGRLWSDITAPSLTSEYTDYIQFFKKNKDLSEDAKTKLKNQIKRFNNQTREVFTSDYITWIKYESKGNLRLNKVARNILFKYCPFSKPIRDSLTSQPIFSDIITRFDAARNKEALILERHYNKLLDNDLSKDSVLNDNLNFYKNM